MLAAVFIFNHFPQLNQRVGIALGVGAVILPFIYCLFWFLLDDYGLWTFKIVLQAHAYLIAEFTNIWSSQNYINVTSELWESVQQSDTSDMSASTWLMGVCGLTMNFIGRMQDYIMCHVTLMVALSMHQAMSNCVGMIKSNPALKTEIWNEYNYMTMLTQKINGQFGLLLILIHVDNGLMISHFLLSSLNQELGIPTILLGVTVVKILTIYYLAMQTSEAVRKIVFLII